MKSRLLIKFFIGSLLVFIVSVGLMSFHGLSSLELELFAPNLFSLRKPYFHYTLDLNSLTTVIPVYTEDSNTETYLRVCRQIIADLKKAQAAAVIIPLVNVSRTMSQRLLTDIAQSHIALFCTDLPNSARGQTYEKRGSWWVNHPAYGQVDFPWGVSSVKPFSRGTLLKFAPYQYREGYTGDTIPDIAVLAASRYLNSSAPLRMTVTPYEAASENLGVPLESDGYSYIQAQSAVWPMWYLYADVAAEDDSIRYAVTSKDYSLQTVWKLYNNKIVILSWNWMHQEGEYASFAHSMYYSAIIKAVINNEYISRYDELALIVIFLVIVIFAILFYSMRVGVGLVVAVPLFPAAILVPRWLYFQHNVLFEPLYILVAIFLSVMILPLLKIIEERRVALETIKSLEEEVRRLEQLTKAQRSDGGTVLTESYRRSL
ncbi:MAG: hypothetical protein V1799_18250 [bacterium]